MRESLRLVDELPELEPRPAFTAELLRSCREESARRIRTGAGMQRLSVVRSLAYAATLAIVSTLVFAGALGTAEHRQGSTLVSAGQSQRSAIAVTASPESLRRTTAEIQALAEAVNTGNVRYRNHTELKYRREALALGADLAEAHAALQRNPGCERASHLMTNNLQRQVKNLRTLYAEQSLQ